MHSGTAALEGLVLKTVTVKLTALVRFAELAAGANLLANSDFVRRIAFSRLTDCADCEIGGNRAFTQLIGENCRSYQ